MKDDFWGLEEKILGDSKTRHLDRDFEEAYDGNGFELEEKKSSKNVWWYFIFIIIMFLGIFSRAFALQIVSGKHYRYLAEGNRIRQKSIDAPRGLIYDSKGIILTENKPQFIVTLIPQDVPEDKNEKVDIATKIALELDIDKNDILSKFDNYKASFDPVILAENIDREHAIVLKEKFGSINCISIDEKLNRQYVSDAALSHVLGYIGKVNDGELKNNSNYSLTDYIGKIGLEAEYEDILKGQKGQKQIEVDAKGDIVSILAEKEPTAGNSINLSIDYNLQKKMYEVLQNYIGQSGARAAVGIAMNPQTGEILSSVSLPSYDNNIFTIKSKEEFANSYNQLINDKATPLINRVIGGIYPPGSTIKPLVASAGLSEGTITPQTSINDPGEILVPNQYDENVVYRFPDWKPGGHGLVNVYKAIAESCDIFFYSVGGGWDKITGLGQKRLEDYFHLFGLGAKTGVDLPSEGEGLVPNPQWKKKVKGEDWYQGDTYHESIGQGDLLVTPLQLVNYISTIANGGNLMTPHYVSKIVDVKGKTIKDQSKQIKKKQIISQNVVDVVREGMRQTVTSGTARSLSTMSVPIAGKTGTAQFENNTSLHSWFVSFAPFDNPKIAMAILFEGGGEGHEVALPATKDILSFYFGK